MRFAQIIDGRVTNPCDGPDVASALSGAFAREYWIGREETWVAVPDGAPPNSRLDGNGGWSIDAGAAPPPPPPSVDDITTRLDELAAKIDKITTHLGIEEDPS